MPDTLKALYDQYEAAVVQVRKKASPTDGLFGMGKDPRDHGCHDAFYETAEEWVKEFAASDPAPERVRDVTAFILRAANRNRDKQTYWYLFAAQLHACHLIPLLRKEDCIALRDEYRETYPRQDRMPAQQQVFKMLQEYAGDRKSEKVSFFQKLFGTK